MQIIDISENEHATCRARNALYDLRIAHRACNRKPAVHSGGDELGQELAEADHVEMVLGADKQKVIGKIANRRLSNN